MIFGLNSSRSFTPAAITNSESPSEYTSGTGIPNQSFTLSIPLRSFVAWSDFSAEKQIALSSSKLNPFPKSVLSLSFAVTRAILEPEL